MSEYECRSKLYFEMKLLKNDGAGAEYCSYEQTEFCDSGSASTDSADLTWNQTADPNVAKKVENQINFFFFIYLLDKANKCS